MEAVGEYHKLQVTQFPVRTKAKTVEGTYWRKFARPICTQQVGIVSHVSYDSQRPHDFAVTSATRVLVFDGETHALKKTIARFPDTALCGSFRGDGRLIVAGCESGLVQVFDLTSRAVLRQLRVHKRATHVTHFTPDRTHVLSASDDTTIRLWDLAQGEQLSRLDGHQDYVRSAANVSDVVWITGSYDHTLKVWDLRTAAAVMTLEHGAPVESVTTIGSAGRLVASAGGASAAVWDMVGGGRLVGRLTNHQKTVTSLQSVAVSDASGLVSHRLLTGALDGHVKVYDLAAFRTVYAFKYPAPVTAVAVAPDLQSMVVGLADRSMVVRRHKSNNSTLHAPGAAEKRPTKRQRSYAPRMTAGSYKYFLRGTDARASEADFVVQARSRARLRDYDHFFKQFRYAEALDAALRTKRADVVAAVVGELVARNGMQSALRGRLAPALVPLLQHICKYIADPDHARMCLQVASLVFDLHSDLAGLDPDLSALVHDLKSRLGAEVKVQQDLQVITGMLDLFLQGQS